MTARSFAIAGRVLDIFGGGPPPAGHDKPIEKKEKP